MAEQPLIDVIKKYGVVWAADGQEFTLASGAKSKFYIDFSRIAMVPEGMTAIVMAIIKEIIPYDYDLFGGPSSGADPIVGAVLSHMPKSGKMVRGFTVRKEPKGRGPGAGDMFEGYLPSGSKAIVIEDVTTSGGSVLKAIKVIEAQGVEVVKVLTLLDRQAGAVEVLKDYDFTAITILKELEL